MDVVVNALVTVVASVVVIGDVAVGWRLRTATNVGDVIHLDGVTGMTANGVGVATGERGIALIILRVLTGKLIKVGVGIAMVGGNKAVADGKFLCIGDACAGVAPPQPALTHRTRSIPNSHCRVLLLK